MHRLGKSYALATAAVLSALPALLGWGCRGCAGGSSAGRPTQFIQKDAEAVIEIRDLGALAKSKASLTKSLSGLMTVEQIEELEREATIILGFDPASDKGLEEAGLPKEGSIAGEIAAEGRGALWVVPVRDAAKFEKVIDRLARTRATVETTEKAKVDGQEITLLQASFGPEKIAVAAYTFIRGFALIGAGPDSMALITRALALDPKGAPDILQNAEYAALDRALGTSGDVRLIIPAVAQTAKSALQALSQAGIPEIDRVLAAAPDWKGAKGGALQLSFGGRGVQLDGRVRLDESAIAKAKLALGQSAEAPKVVRALDFDDAVLFGWFSGNPQALITELAPPGSPLRAELDRALARGKQELDTDIEKEVLPLVSGHGAFAMGVGNLAGADLAAILESPARYLWTLVAIGSSDPQKLAELAKRIDRTLEPRGFAISERKSGGAGVHVVGRAAAAGAPQEVLIESAALDRAVLLSNDAAATDRALAATADSKAKPIPLEGKAGMLFELRLASLTQKLETLNLYQLPILYRTIVAKGLQMLHALERFSIALRPADDGVALQVRLQLSPPEGSPSKK